MCQQIVNLDGALLTSQGELRDALAAVGVDRPLVMRDGRAAHAEACLCPVDLEASLRDSGFAVVPAWDTHGTDWQLVQVSGDHHRTTALPPGGGSSPHAADQTS